MLLHLVKMFTPVQPNNVEGNLELRVSPILADRSQAQMIAMAAERKYGAGRLKSKIETFDASLKPELENRFKNTKRL